MGCKLLCFPSPVGSRGVSWLPTRFVPYGWGPSRPARPTVRGAWPTAPRTVFHYAGTPRHRRVTRRALQPPGDARRPRNLPAVRGFTARTLPVRDGKDPARSSAAFRPDVDGVPPFPLGRRRRAAMQAEDETGGRHLRGRRQYPQAVPPYVLARRAAARERERALARPPPCGCPIWTTTFKTTTPRPRRCGRPIGSEAVRTWDLVLPVRQARRPRPTGRVAKTSSTSPRASGTATTSTGTLTMSTKASRSAPAPSQLLEAPTR